MPSTTINWSWTEAFDKFGFDDGDGLVMTWHGADVLNAAGFEAEADSWGLHNVVITSIVCPKRGQLMPDDSDEARIGYSDPRGYLPSDVIALLDRELPD